MKSPFGRLVTAVLILMSACQMNPGPDGISTQATPRPGVPSRTPIGTEDSAMPDLPMTPDPDAQRMVQLAKESLAGKFKISVDQIHLSSVQAMNWPDASLGCPQPGILYAQVVTAGFQIMLEAIGQAFVYHTDATDRVILCDMRPPDEIFPPP